jgi:hypothetical protein
LSLRRHSVQALIGLGAALTLTLVGLRLQISLTGRPDPTRSTITMIGIPGLAWPRVAELAHGGRLPALKSVFDGDRALGEIQGQGYPGELQVLASIVTGTLPRKHLAIDEPRIATDSVWKRLYDRGDRVAVVGFPFGDPVASWSVLPDPGSMSGPRVLHDGADVSLERDWQLLFAEASASPEAVMLEIDSREALPETVRDELAAALAADALHASIAARLMVDEPGIHLFLYLDGMLRWQRALADVGGDRSELINDYYQWLDSTLARVTMRCRADSTCILFSEREPDGNGLETLELVRGTGLPSFGFFAAWGSQIRLAPRPIRIAPPDLGTTVLYLTGGPLPQDQDGAVLLGMLDDGIYQRRPIQFSR